jgi:hypothetical protein
MASRRHSEETLTATSNLNPKRDFMLRLGETIVDQKTRSGLSLVLTTRRAVTTGPNRESTQHVKLTGQIGQGGNYVDADGKPMQNQCCFFDRHGRARRRLDDFLHEDLAHYCQQWPDNTYEGSVYTPVETRVSRHAS